jgi:hypothetical protein
MPPIPPGMPPIPPGMPPIPPGIPHIPPGKGIPPGNPPGIPPVTYKIIVLKMYMMEMGEIRHSRNTNIYKVEGVNCANF